jgi:Protein kinase domain
VKYLWDDFESDKAKAKPPRKTSPIKLKSSPQLAETPNNTLESFKSATRERQLTVASEVAHYVVVSAVVAFLFFLFAYLFGFSTGIRFVISSADQLALAITACVFSLSLAFLVAGRHLIKPNRLALSTNGVELFRSMANFDQIEVLSWKDIKKIDIVRGTGQQASRNLALWCYKPGLGQTHYSFPLTTFGSSNWRKLLEDLQEYLPEQGMGLGLKQELQRIFGKSSQETEGLSEAIPDKPVSYTELWLQSLHDGEARVNRDDLKPSARLCEGRFEVVSKLGSGGQGSVYLAKEHDPDKLSGEKKFVALKEFVLPDYAGHAAVKKVLFDVEREAQLLNRLKHEGIVKLQDTFTQDWRAYFVMEHLNGESFRSLVERTGALPEQAVKTFALQMCDILSYLHGREPPVVHRDFTPENLMLCQRNAIKLIDFNVALQAEINSGKTVVGKRSFMPPEQFRGQPSAQSDIYALGGTLHFLLTGLEPQPLKQSHPSSHNPTVSDGFNQVVERCSALNLTERFKTAEEVKLALQELP